MKPGFATDPAFPLQVEEYPKQFYNNGPVILIMIKSDTANISYSYRSSEVKEGSAIEISKSPQYWAGLRKHKAHPGEVWEGSTVEISKSPP